MVNKPDQSPWALDTLLVHGDEQSRRTRRAGVPTVLPIYTSTTYLHQNAEALERAFSDHSPSGEQAYIYAQQGNPNAHALEHLLAQAEGGVGAVAFGSGMAAIHTSLLAAGLAPGTRVLVARDLYGATIGLLRKVFLPLGVEVIVRDLCTPTAASVIRTEQPDVILVETLSNPLVKMVDLDAISAAAHEVGAVSVVDSTFTTPYLVRPLDHGFDLVVHSATKYLGGHGDSTAGVVISAKHTLLERVRACATLFGATVSPFELYLVMRGLKTLSLRMERHCRNALQVACFLHQHPAVERVHYPGLPGHPQYALASRLLSHRRYGGMLSFELKQQSREAVFCFLDRLKLCLPATTLGDVCSLVSYPPMSSHRDLTESERCNSGITEGCIRLSVGIEDVGDIINDLDTALSIFRPNPDGFPSHQKG
jgi:cystathionine beta-lyase/cystathionine gamma-synthase